MGTQLPLKRAQPQPLLFGPCLLWPNGWMDQDATWYRGTVGLGPSHIVLDGEPAPLQKRGTAPPQFSAHVCSGNTAGWIKIPLGMELGFGSGHIALDGDPAPLPKRSTSLQFSAHVCCGQTAGWIKMPLGTKVGLGPGHIVLHGDSAAPSLPKKRAHPPIFGPYRLWPNGRPSQLLPSTSSY